MRIDVVSVRAKQLAVPLTEGLCLRPEDSAVEASEKMLDRQYDFAPVLEEGSPIGLFAYSAFGDSSHGALVSEAMEPLNSATIVSGETRLETIINRLNSRPFLFVLEENGFSGFLTPSDLGSVGVRAHFYSHLSLLEILLGEYLRLRYPDQSKAISLLKAGRLESQKAIVADLRSRDRFLDEISCVSLQDLIDICGKDSEFRAAVARTGTGWNKVDRGFGEFRDAIMHSSRPLSTLGMTEPAMLLKMQRRIDALSEAVEKMLRSLPRS
ncbi:MAG: CBS domain-containing protein [Brachybacterium sp.]|uniref:CBS domain-containing protein n=1 Tax=Brachybacterium sp. TaxID=1891286 RepID=UPI003F8ECFEA